MYCFASLRPWNFSSLARALLYNYIIEWKWQSTEYQVYKEATQCFLSNERFDNSIRISRPRNLLIHVEPFLYGVSFALWTRADAKRVWKQLTTFVDHSQSDGEWTFSDQYSDSRAYAYRWTCDCCCMRIRNTILGCSVFVLQYNYCKHVYNIWVIENARRAKFLRQNVYNNIREG